MKETWYMKALITDRKQKRKLYVVDNGKRGQYKIKAKQ
jgi:hypothetical protein